MPFVQLPDALIHYELSGSPGAPVLLLSHSLGVHLSMWEPQLAEFSKHFHVLRYDTRGHGSSSVPSGDYSIAVLAQDVLHLLDALSIDRAHFCGISMGGMTGMWLAANAPNRFHKIVLSNTAVKIGTPDTWAARIASVRSKGMGAVAPAVIERWVGTYASAADHSVILDTPCPGVRIAIVTSGTGASTGPAIGEEVVAALFDESRPWLNAA